MEAGPGLVFYGGDYSQAYKSGSTGLSINSTVAGQILTTLTGVINLP